MLNFCSFSFFMPRQPWRAYGSTPSDTPHSVGLLWTNDQPVVETSTWQHTTLIRDRHPCRWRRFEPATPASERPQTPRLRPRGQWVQRTYAFNDWNRITVCTGGFNVCAHLPFSCSSLGLHLGSPERCLALWIPTAAAPSSRKQRRWCTEESGTAPTPSRGGTSPWWLQTSWRCSRMASCVRYDLWKWSIISVWYLLLSLVILVQVQSNSVLMS